MKQRIKFVMVLGIVSILLSPNHTNQVNALPATSASEMLQLVNQFRLDNGLPPFQLNGALASAAQNQANYMAEFMVFSNHSGYGGSTPLSRAEAAGYYGAVSENIVGGTGMSSRQGMIWWQNSAVHYRTLVTSRYLEAGTGFATNGSENFYVLVVGSPSNTGAPPAAPQVDNSPAPLFVTPIVKAVPGEDGSIVHVVQEGQALWSLAAYYEVLLSDLLLYNGLSDSSFLSPGDEIIIQLAEGQPPPPTPTPPTSVIVQEGQSLWSIAAVYNVKFGDLLWFNNINEDSVLQPGDEIMIRLAEGQAPPPTPTPVVYHIIRSGQTLWDIALTYGLSLDELLSLNNISAEMILQPGDELMVRLPPPTATPNPTATYTPQPTVVLVETAVSAHLPSSSPNQLTASTPQPTINPSISANSNALRLGETVGTGALILVFGLVAIGGVAFYMVGHRE
ncbi:MAG: LysM peptidoglycan-binding domain-containing protein [Chloroflexi bacterium]|nr:MAG: LysM peptidoglycan-binding domain-containing protein [Chloroflexota bacterium]